MAFEIAHETPTDWLLLLLSVGDPDAGRHLVQGRGLARRVQAPWMTVLRYSTIIRTRLQPRSDAKLSNLADRPADMLTVNQVFQGRRWPAK
jgi:hypothetical protein